MSSQPESIRNFSINMEAYRRLSLADKYEFTDREIEALFMNKTTEEDFAIQMSLLIISLQSDSEEELPAIIRSAESGYNDQPILSNLIEDPAPFFNFIIEKYIK